MKTSKIHVNQHNIKHNRKGLNSGLAYEEKPVITVKTYNTNDYTNEATICCPGCGEKAAQVVYKPETPLACGAHVWIETKGKVLTK